ncbi:MAG: SH3 domain-containing protein [Hyphomicrobiales bacterium]|nr:SH3 domain-containing protein [Hyphomicrobiales bacterium]
MRKCLFAACLCVSLLAVPAAANNLPTFTNPGYYEVVGVNANDVLNIRAEPSASSSVIGSFRPGAAPIEVIGTSGNWGRVIAGEGNGWVSMNFLSEIDPGRIGNSGLPIGLSCFGTEPFWDLDFETDSEAAYSDLGGDIESRFQIVSGSRAAGRPNVDAVWMRVFGWLPATAIVRREICSDGMSDRDYGYAVGFSINTPGGPRTLDGCCWLRPPQ